jgi:hypothetical protein
MFRNRDRVQVQNQVREDHNHAVPPVHRRRVPEDAPPELRIADLVTQGHGHNAE